MIHRLYHILTGCWLRAKAILIVLMETGNHRDRNKIICCSRCEDTQGNGMQLHTVEWHYPQQPPPPLHSLPYGDLEETSSVVVMLRNDAGTLSTPPLLQYYPCGLLRKMQHSSSAPFPAWSLTPNSNQPSAFISFMWKWKHLSVMLIIISA